MEAGAGRQALVPDALYTDAGATIGDPWGAEVVVKVAAPSDDEVARLARGQILIGFLAPLTRPEAAGALARGRRHGVRDGGDPADLRAQSMDALSSQSNVARLQGGAARRRALDALLPDADDRGGHDPAGQGAGAGHRRRGAAGAGHRAPPRRRRPPATTCGPRWPSRSQSLGAKWLDLGIEAAGEGGYARELTDEERAQQQQALTDAIKGFDVVITTALVPGRPAPRWSPPRPSRA